MQLESLLNDFNGTHKDQKDLIYRVTAPPIPPFTVCLLQAVHIDQHLLMIYFYKRNKWHLIVQIENNIFVSIHLHTEGFLLETAISHFEALS